MKNKTTNEALKSKKNTKDFTGVKRAAYIVAFACMLSIAAYFGILVSEPDTGQKVLGGFAVISAINYFIQAIK